MVDAPTSLHARWRVRRVARAIGQRCQARRCFYAMPFGRPRGAKPSVYHECCCRGRCAGCEWHREPRRGADARVGRHVLVGLGEQGGRPNRCQQRRRAHGGCVLRAGGRAAAPGVG
eukprot:363414-Chlamydomonas_euryale.AAC.1